MELRNIKREDVLRQFDWLGEVVDIEDPLKDGRVKIKVFGKFDELETELIPWATPYTTFTGGSETGSGFFSPPKLNSIVGVKFDNDNIYEPIYYNHVHLSDDLKTELDSSYENAFSLIYDTVTEGGFKIYFTEGESGSGTTGLVFNYKDTIVNIKNDNSFEVRNPNGDNVEILNDGTININCSSNVNITNEGDTNVETKGHVHLNSKDVKLGPDFVEKILKGESFQRAYNMHTHPTPTGPTGPPIQISPPTHLSKTTKSD